MFLQLGGTHATRPRTAIFGAQKRRVRPDLLGFRSSAALPDRNMRFADNLTKPDGPILAVPSIQTEWMLAYVPFCFPLHAHPEGSGLCPSGETLVACAVL